MNDEAKRMIGEVHALIGRLITAGHIVTGRRTAPTLSARGGSGPYTLWPTDPAQRAALIRRALANGGIQLRPAPKDDDQ